MIESRTLNEPFQSSFGNGRDTSVADLPAEKGGAGKGFGPHDLLEAALATCITMTVRMHAAKHDMPLESARCIVRIDRSDAAVAKLDYELELEGTLTTEQISELRRAARQCPVGRTLSHPIRVRDAASP